MRTKLVIFLLVVGVCTEDIPMASLIEGISFIDAPENQYPVVGNDFKVKCKVKGNSASIIDWNKNDQAIQTNNKYVVDTEGLLIKNVTVADDAVYKCTVMEITTRKSITKNIKVEVLVPPKIQPMPTITIIDGETASARCVASGKPPPTYQWIKMKDRQDLSVADRFEVKKNTGELMINRVEFENDDGLYKCIAENTVDRVETTVRINVLVRPRIYELLNLTAPVKIQTEIICKAYGRPPPRVTFRKLSRRDPFKIGFQLEDSRISLEQQSTPDTGESFGTLVISNLSRSDDGLYECIAENTAGAAYKNGHITVEFPPTFARTKDLPRVWTWGNRPGNLTCLPEAIPNATTIWKYKGTEIEDSNNFQKIGIAPFSYLSVKPYNDKRFFTTYECIATNRFGRASIKIELKQAFEPGPVLQAKIHVMTPTSIKWGIIPPISFEGLPLRSYTVRYKSERDLSWELARNHTWSFGGPYLLENLIPEETYHFQFAARNDVGLGNFQNVTTVIMPRKSAPSELKILLGTNRGKDESGSNREDMVAMSPYTDRFELRLSMPNDNGDPIINYFIKHCVTEKIHSEWHDHDCTETIHRPTKYMNFLVDNLHPDTIYKIEVYARNSIGNSWPSTVRVKTARNVNSSVDDVC